MTVDKLRKESCSFSTAIYRPLLQQTENATSHSKKEDDRVSLCVIGGVLILPSSSKSFFTIISTTLHDCRDMTVPDDSDNGQSGRQSQKKKKIVYSNKWDAVKQSLKQARRNRAVKYEQSGLSDNESNNRNGTQVLNIDKKVHDMNGLGIIIAISFLSTGFVIAMRRYIFAPGEFWKQGAHAQYRQSKQNFHHSTFHNSRYGRGHDDGNVVVDRDHQIKNYLTLLELPVTNLQPSRKEIKSAYRRICLRTHPDVLKSNYDVDNMMKKKRLEERFILATKAHDELLKFAK